MVEMVYRYFCKNLLPINSFISKLPLFFKRKKKRYSSGQQRTNELRSKYKFLLTMKAVKLIIRYFSCWLIRDNLESWSGYIASVLCALEIDFPDSSIYTFFTRWSFSLVLLVLFWPLLLPSLSSFSAPEKLLKNNKQINTG